MDIRTVKAISVVTLFLAAVVISLLAFKLRRYLKPAGDGGKWKELLFCAINSFSGGVFLGSCLLHLLPEGQQEIAIFFKRSKIETNFPFPELLIGFGFFLVYSIDALIVTCQNWPRKGKNEAAKKCGGRTDKKGTETVYSSINVSESRQPGVQENGEGKQNLLSSTKPNNDSVPEALDSDCNGIQERNKITSNEKRSKSFIGETQKDEEEGRKDIPGEDFITSVEGSILGIVVLLLALEFHMGVVGLSIGLQRTESAAWTFLIAVLCHKVLVAFSLGLKLGDKPVSAKFAIAYLFAFSVATPIGVVLGIFLSDFSIDHTARHATSGVMQCIAAGTFLHITFFEVFSKHTAYKHCTFFLVFAAGLGFAAIAGTLFLNF